MAEERKTAGPDDNDPLANAGRLRAMAALGHAYHRINIDRVWALKIADQLEGLHAEYRKNFDLLCRTEEQLARALLAIAIKEPSNK